MLSELYKSGRLRQDILGVLAKTVICIKTGCIASGPEAYVLDKTIQLAETIAISPKPQKTPPPKQPQTKTRQEVKPPPLQKPPPQPPPPPQRHEPGQVHHSWDTLISLLAREAKVDKPKAENILNALASYLSVYPSVGLLRLIEDVSRKTRTDARAVKAAVDILRSLDYVEVKEEGVVNLKKALRTGGEILL